MIIVIQKNSNKVRKLESRMRYDLIKTTFQINLFCYVLKATFDSNRSRITLSIIKINQIKVFE